jgi:cytochrome c
MKQIVTVLLAALMLLWASVGYAKEPANYTDAKTLVDQALAHIKKVGYDQAIKDFSADSAQWGIATRPKNAYVTAYTLDGVALAHSVNSSLIGRNLLEIKDQSGRQPIKEATEIAKKGAGQLTYKWANPVTKKIGTVESVIARVPGKDAFIWGIAFAD